MLPVPEGRELEGHHFRFGKVFITEQGSTWNFYGEIRKTVWYDDNWPGSVLDTALRVNLSYAFPM